VTCVSEGIESTLSQDFEIEEEKVIIIPNGYPSTLLQFPPHYDEIRDLVTIGNLRKEKDPMTLLKSIELIRKKLPNIILHWIGEGNLRKDMMKYIKGQNLEEHIHLLGVLPHKKAIEILSNADVFVMSSTKEGLPTALIEAMALAKPVVVTKVGGIPDLITNGVNGILVAPYDSEAMSQAIQQLANSLDLARGLGQSARERVAGLNWTSIAGQYYRLYETVLQQREN
jgi:glycosyltransferase involved in cell wall biosynthesis